MNNIIKILATFIILNLAVEIPVAAQTDLGSYSQSFRVQENAYSGTSYRLTITQPMTLTIHNYATFDPRSIEVDTTAITVKDAISGTIIGEQNKSLNRKYIYDAGKACLSLENVPAGTYDVVVTGNNTYNPLTIQGYPSTATYSHAGEDRHLAIDLGNPSYEFSYSHLRNTDDGRYWSTIGYPNHDVYYKFTLTYGMYVVVNHWGSPIADVSPVSTRIYILHYDPLTNIYTTIGTGGEPMDANAITSENQIDDLEVPYDVLPEIENFNPNAAAWHGYLDPGQYYIASETPCYGGNMGYVYEGLLLTNIHGFTFPYIGGRKSIHAGTSANGRLEFGQDTKFYSATRNDAIIYSFTLDEDSSLAVNTTGNTVLLKRSGTTIDSGTVVSGKAWETRGLEAGDYDLYIYGSADGNITTSFSSERYYKPDHDYCIGDIQKNFSFRDRMDLRTQSDTILDFKFRIKEACTVLFDYRGSSSSVAMELKDSTTNEIVISKTVLQGETSKFTLNLEPGVYYHEITGTGSMAAVVNLGIRVHEEPYSSFGQDDANLSSRSYIVTYHPTDEGISSPSLSNSNVLVEYYDGLGRPHQTIRRAESPYGEDLATYTLYDCGRPVENWSETPVGKSGNFKGYDTVAASAVRAHAGDDKGFSKIEYEATLLNRVSQHTGPGKVWHAAGKGIKYEYIVNTDAGVTSCLEFSVSGAYDSILLPVSEGVYPAGALSVIKSTSEDNVDTYEFKDVHGRTVLHRTVTESGYSDNYFVYDRRGLLRAVITPAASDNLSQDLFNRYCYGYGYDTQGRCVARKLPGMAVSRTIYAKSGHPMFTQSPRQEAIGLWSFNIPDIYGRTAITGTTSLNSTVLYDMADANAYAARSSSSPATGYYSVPGFQFDIEELHQALYYDDYSFLSYFGTRAQQLGFDATFNSDERRDSEGSSLTCKGLLTGSLSIGTGTEDMFLSAQYHDRYGNVTQHRSENLLGGVSTLSLQHDFQGNVKYEHEVHTGNGVQSHDMVRSYSYDRGGRPVTVSVNLDGIEVTTKNTYDDTGRLEMRMISSENVSDTTIFTHNIRGWQTGLANKHWSSEIRYEAPQFSESGLYSGNISEWEWIRDNASKAYSFSYDELSRITGSMLFENGIQTDSFSEKEISYDKGGNIMSLTRSADGSVTEFTYDYDGNRLSSFAENGQQSQTYAYDADGNMTFDGRNAMLLTWNDLGLIEKVSRNGSTLVNYSYLADGTKVSVLDGSGNGLLYLGSLIYRKNGSSTSLESACFDGGRFVVAEGSGGESVVPQIHITDHLGSIRAIVDAVSGEAIETNDFYPFGKRWDDQASLYDQSNRYRFNGKEEQSSLYPASYGSQVSYIDYGARQYDPVIGRWLSVDPLAEKYSSISPYAFCNNNPIRYEDVNGEDWYDKVVGYFVGGVTNVVPGTGFIRDRYSPDNSADYNYALKRTDEAAAALGIGMMKAGTGTMAAGGVLATAGVGVTASTAGVGVVVGGPAVAAGAEMAAVGAATAATGGVMVMNSSKNKSDGYKRGKSSKNSSSDYTFIQGTPGNKRKVTTQIPNGYKKVKGHYPHGADVFYNGKRYISPDKDNHNGGMWKMAKKMEDLFNKNKRMGTYDENLKRIGD